MCGWWHGDCEVQSQTPTVKATTFTHGEPRQTIVVVTNFGAATNATLLIDWARLGFKHSSASIRAPAVYNFQPDRVFVSAAGGLVVLPLGAGMPHAGQIPSPPGGWILVIEEKIVQK